MSSFQERNQGPPLGSLSRPRDSPKTRDMTLLWHPPLSCNNITSPWNSSTFAWCCLEHRRGPAIANWANHSLFQPGTWNSSTKITEFSPPGISLPSFSPKTEVTPTWRLQISSVFLKFKLDGYRRNISISSPKRI